jgi:4-amino-4-deoxy-L-arabinose transferase-like glycosyltransferase
MPALAASLISVAFTYRLGRSLFGAPGTAALAAALMALSPYSILFAITAFTDPLLVLWILAALVLCARGRLGSAGLCFGLALATKQTALFLLPLLVAVAYLSGHISRLGHALMRFTLGLMPAMIALVAWDAARGAPAGFWQQSVASYGGLRLATFDELPPRLAGWSEWWSYLWGSPWLTGLFTLMIVVMLAIEIATLRSGGLSAGRRTLCSTPTQVLVRVGGQPANGPPAPTSVGRLLAAFALGFLAVHVLLTFSVWDRYLLGLVPILALLTAHSLARFGSHLARLLPDRTVALQRSFPVVLVILLLGPAWQAAHSQYPIGGDHGAYDGIDQVAAYLRRMPWGTVLYDQALNWELDYYLYDGPIYVAWFATPEGLTDDLRAFREHRTPRFLIVPSWHPMTGLPGAVAAAGYRQDVVLTTFRRDGQPSFLVYQLTPDRHADANGDMP